MKIAKVAGGFFENGSNFFRIKERYVMTSSVTGVTGTQTAAIDREGGRILVSIGINNEVKILDYVTLNVTDTILIGGSAYGCTIDRNGGRLLVCSPSLGVIKVLDYTTSSTVLATLTGFNTGSGPHASSLDPASGRIFVTNSNQVSVRDYNNPTTVLATLTGFNGGRGVVVDAPYRILVSNQFGNSISVLDYNNPTTVLATLTGFIGPFGIDIDYRNNIIFVSNVSGNTISILDYTTLTLVGTISAASGNLSSPRFLAVDTYSNRLLIPNNIISII